ARRGQPAPRGAHGEVVPRRLGRVAEAQGAHAHRGVRRGGRARGERPQVGRPLGACHARDVVQRTATLAEWPATSAPPHTVTPPVVTMTQAWYSTGGSSSAGLAVQAAAADAAGVA